MRHFLVIGLTVLSAVAAGGCGERQPPLAGGKPVGSWVRALENPDAKVRKEAAFKLGNVGPADPAALPALIGALRDRDPAVRREAIMAVLKCGPAAKEAVPALAELEQHDRDALVRSYAAKALTKLRSEK
jgi:HEAT repeat protein